MCSTYEGRLTHQEIDRMLRSNFTDLPSGSAKYTINVDSVAPVIAVQGTELVATEMHFRLIPSWSKTKDIKFSTHNARMIGEGKLGEVRKVFEAPTFKKAYTSGKILVPMSSFIEPAYWGELQGTMVRFERDEGTPLFCAGISDEWVDKKSGELFSGYSLLMHEPYETVFLNGHHRSPFFISPSVFQQWMAIRENHLSFDFLLKNRETPNLKTSVQRPMADGWHKRQTMHVKKAEAEGLSPKI